jgi:hypothetical protein
LIVRSLSELHALQVTLRPGIMLFLPPGVLHRVTTTQFTVVVAGNFLPPDCWAPVTSALTRVLRDEASSHVMEGLGDRFVSLTYCMVQEANRLCSLSDEAFASFVRQKWAFQSTRSLALFLRQLASRDLQLHHRFSSDDAEREVRPRMQVNDVAWKTQARPAV